MSTEEPPRVIESWAFEGIMLRAGNGWVTPAELLAYAQHAQEHYPTERVLLHQWGLRVVSRGHAAPLDDGPRLEWRDWD